MVQNIILDFDGVILESVDVKTKAFQDLFAFTPEHIDEIIRYHLANGGISRFDKFRHIYSCILKESLSDAKFKELSQRFSELVFNTILETPFVAGSLEFISSCYRTKSIHVVTATPDEEIRRIVHARNLEKYFTSIYGAPMQKVAAIEEILKKNRICDSRSVVFIGDAKNDWQAATATGVRFIGRVRPGDKNPFDGLPNVERIIPDLRNLRAHLET